MIDNIRDVFTKAKYLEKDKLGLHENKKYLEWIISKGLIFTISESDIIYLTKDTYIQVILDDEVFILNKIMENVVHTSIVVGYTIEEVIQVAKFELANDKNICLN